MTRGQIEELVKWLNARTEEYDEGAPSVSDQDWDRLYFKLQKAECETGIILENSPTRSIHYDIQTELKKKTHDHPMLSLAKTKSIDELKKFIGNKQVVTMLKMDGLTCSLRYEKGKLVSAETRGDGEVGEDITANCIAVPAIPKYLDCENIIIPDVLVVDGEIVCKDQDFEEFSEEYANSRNFAAGSIRLLDPNEVAKRKLSFVAWDVIEGLDYPSLAQKLNYLNDFRFETVPGYVNDSNDFEIENIIESLKDTAAAEGYPIDGIVVKYDDVDYYKSLGNTAHHPAGGIAYKFTDETMESTLIGIDYDVSRTGQLTPVAVFEPIQLMGSEVSRASLHNISIMTDVLHGPGWKGQKVTIFKANMIIPQCQSAEEDDGTTKEYFTRPVCPICGATTVIRTSDSGVKVLYCPNEECEGKLAQRIDHFLGKKGLDAKGISRKTIEFLIDKGWVNELKDIFNLSKYQKEWTNTAGFGVASVNKILNGIEEAKHCTFDSIIAGAGIPLVGSRIAKQIAEKANNDYWTFRDMVNSNYSFSEWSGFGYEMERALLEYDYSELDFIVENYLTIEAPIAVVLQNSSNNLAGKVLVITGKLSKKRDDIIADIEAAGGKVTGSVSKNTTYLVCNNPEDTTKYHKAEQLGIPIITEEELNKMM